MFKLLAGPCSIENEVLVMQVAKVVKEITDELGIDYYFKASFEKSKSHFTSFI
jgi:2-dehydro-3-deoxyphosphooctonate aldolase (KDO 8-P synthase)